MFVLCFLEGSGYLMCEGVWAGYHRFVKVSLWGASKLMFSTFLCECSHGLGLSSTCVTKNMSDKSIIVY